MAVNANLELLYLQFQLTAFVTEHAIMGLVNPHARPSACFEGTKTKGRLCQKHYRRLKKYIEVK